MSLPAGTRLGPYEILSPLGTGGMGEVYRARDTELDRDVAIKVLPQSVAADPETLARFEREAKAVSALSHQNILAIHDFGNQGGIAYAVMELLEGETLRERLDAGPVSQKQAFDYALQIARGLSAAHEKGIVHRDLKPENIFVTKDSHLKILDFGLAKRLDPKVPSEETSAPTASVHTEPGTVVGTVGYMSPEQVRGLALDRRSDIFSFGAILYELISGKKAFHRSTASDTMVAILRDQPPELSESGRSTSPFLDQIVRHCLEKDRDERFQSAKDIAFALGEASSSTALSGVRPPSERTGRPKLLIAAVALVLVVAVAVLVVRKPQRTSAPAGMTRLAVLPFENLGAPEDDYFADGVADEVRGKLTSLPGVLVIARGSSTPYKKSTRTPKQIAEELNVSYLLTATVRWEKAGGKSRVQVRPELVDVTRPDAPTSKWQQPFDAALTDVFQVQSDIATRVARALGVALGAGEEERLSERPSQDLAAYDAFLKGEDIWNRMGGDPPALRKELAFYEQAVALDSGFSQAWARVSSANSILYFNSAPRPELAERARQAAEKAIALAPNRPEGYRALANYKQSVLGDIHGALEQYEKAKSIGPGEADLALQLGNALMNVGRWDAAIENFRQAQRLDPKSADAFTNMAVALLYLRRYPEAHQAIDHALSLSPPTLYRNEIRGKIFLAEGNLAGLRASIAAPPPGIAPTELVVSLASYLDVWVLAEPQLELLLRLTPAAFDNDRGTWALSLAQASALKGDAANVRMYAEEARKALEVQIRMTPKDPQRHLLLGLALAYLGRKEEASREGERGVALEPVAENAFYGPEIQHELVRIYMLVGEPEKALDQLEPLLKIPYQLSPGWLKIDPNFDSLRDHPRFRKLVAGAK